MILLLKGLDIGHVYIRVKKHLGSFLFESDEDVDNPHYLNKRTGMHSPQILNP